MAAVADEKRRKDALEVFELMQDVTEYPAKMWGPSMVGFGSYRYKYENGREGEWMAVGFLPRKQDLTLYIQGGFERYEALMQKLGKFKIGKSCLYIKKLEDIDLPTLRSLVKDSVAYITKADS